MFSLYCSMKYYQILILILSSYLLTESYWILLRYPIPLLLLYFTLLSFT